MPAEAGSRTLDAEVLHHLLEAIRKIRRQKQRPTVDRIHHALQRDGVAASFASLGVSDVANLLEAAVRKGNLESLCSTTGIVSYKELPEPGKLTQVSQVKSSELDSDGTADGEALVADVSAIEQHRVPASSPAGGACKSSPKKTGSSSKKGSKSGSDNTSKHRRMSDNEPGGFDLWSKPSLVVDTHTDLSDVVMGVIQRLGSASGKILEKDIRSHYLVEVVAGADLRRQIRVACKALIRQQEVQQRGNNFELAEEDGADVTLTVDERVESFVEALPPEEQEDLMVPSLFICSDCKEIEEDRSNVVTCTDCGVGKHVKCMSKVAAAALTLSVIGSPRSWLCHACRPCTVCSISCRSKKQRLGSLLVCELCDNVYHPDCCNQSATAKQKESWICPKCHPEGSNASVAGRYADANSFSDDPDVVSSPPTRSTRVHSQKSHNDVAATLHTSRARRRTMSYDSQLNVELSSADEAGVLSPGCLTIDVQPDTDSSPHKPLMSPCVELSPLRSVDSAKSRRSDGNASSCSIQQRRRSRNMQLSSLFDSLTQFFSANGERRRRTAYLNAAASLVTDTPSRNPHPTPKPSSRVTKTEAPAPSKSVSGSSRQSTKESGGRQRKLSVEEEEEEEVVSIEDIKQSRGKKTVKGMVQARLSEPETKLFNTAQTIAQQRMLVSEGMSLAQAQPVVIVGKYQFITSHLAPYLPDFTSFSKLFLCEFCFKCLTSDSMLKRHQVKCAMGHPPGIEIYRREALSVYEVRGQNNHRYCTNIGLFSRLFMNHESLFSGAVHQFIYYVLCYNDSYGSHVVGFFTKKPGSDHNMACLLVLPPHHGNGFTQFLIEFSYHLCHMSSCVGSPQLPLTEELSNSLKFYWKSAIVQFLHKNRSSQGVITPADISRETGITVTDVTQTLCTLRLMNSDASAIDMNINKIKDWLRRLSVGRKLQVPLDPSLICWDPAGNSETEKAMPRLRRQSSASRSEARSSTEIQRLSMSSSDESGSSRLPSRKRSTESLPFASLPAKLRKRSTSSSRPNNGSRKSLVRPKQSKKLGGIALLAGKMRMNKALPAGGGQSLKQRQNQRPGKPATKSATIEYVPGAVLRRSPRTSIKSPSAAVSIDKTVMDDDTQLSEKVVDQCPDVDHIMAVDDSNTETIIADDMSLPPPLADLDGSKLAPVQAADVVHIDHDMTSDDDEMVNVMDDSGSIDHSPARCSDAHKDDVQEEVASVKEQPLVVAHSPGEDATVDSEATDNLVDSLSSEAGSVDVMSPLVIDAPPHHDDAATGDTATTIYADVASPQSEPQEMQTNGHESPDELNESPKAVSIVTADKPHEETVRTEMVSTPVAEPVMEENRTISRADVAQVLHEPCITKPSTPPYRMDMPAGVVKPFDTHCRSPPPPVSATPSDDLRRGAMWRDSRFPSDFPPPERACDKYQTGRPPGKAPNKLEVEPTEVQRKRLQRNDFDRQTSGEKDSPASWESHLRHGSLSSRDSELSQLRHGTLPVRDNETSHLRIGSLSSRGSEMTSRDGSSRTVIDSQSLATAGLASVPSCCQVFPSSSLPVTAASLPSYHYGGVDKSEAHLSSGRYSAPPRRSTTESYARGLGYGMPSPSESQVADVSSRYIGAPSHSAHHQRGLGSNLDQQRLSHAWTGSPLPAHQHHVSLSHLPHLVPDDLQYCSPKGQLPSATPPSVAMTPPVMHMTPPPSSGEAGYSRSCQQRQHSGRQQHRSHKQTAATTSAAAAANQAGALQAAAASYDMFSACHIQQPIGYFAHHQGTAGLPMGVVGLHHAQSLVAAAANFGQPMHAGQPNSAMYSAAAAAAAYNYLNGGGLQPFNVDINSVMRR